MTSPYKTVVKGE